MGRRLFSEAKAILEEAVQADPPIAQAWLMLAEVKFRSCAVQSCEAKTCRLCDLRVHPFFNAI